MNPTNCRIVGRCSLCGGDVTVPVYFSSIVPPVPTCSNCGAQQARTQLPVVEMESAPKVRR